MTQTVEFRRIVVGLPYRVPPHAVRLAAELARLLHLDVQGLFVEEESLRGLAALPFAREFHPLGGGWRPLDVERLSRDMEIARSSAEKVFAEAAKTLDTACRFEVVRGSIAQTLATISGSGDIVLITEPETEAERITAQFRAAVDAAIRSLAAVLLVPARIARHSGAIVAVATGPGDPSIEVAKALARAANTEVIVVGRYETGAEGPPAQTGAAGKAAGIRQLGSALGNVRERLIVVTRSEQNPPTMLASLRRVPVLILEPVRGDEEGRSSGN
ncbi:MAG TPA: hypothetical protein VNL39_01405 [Xanthobacteraceae bacterium]|nr:hypothetical protein [Xanthobacteraceae bacterium]